MFKSSVFMNCITLLSAMLLSAGQAVAQGGSVDFLRSTGKIYTVVIVIAVIFIGIVIYLYRLDHKLTKLENQIKNEQ
jgi:CcmD family protein